jgi:hypothetical protein
MLALSQHPSAPRPPLVKMAEQPGQLLQATRPPWSAQPGKPQRYDDAYARVGTVNVVLGTEPLTGWRTLAIAAPRTALDGAHQHQPLLADSYPAADKVIVVGDTLNTPQSASLSEAFAPQEARRRARRLA